MKSTMFNSFSMRKLFMFVMCQVWFPQDPRFNYGTSRAYCASVRNPIYIVSESYLHLSFIMRSQLPW